MISDGTRLLPAYLHFFVPFTDLNAQSPYRSSLLHYSSGYDSLVLENVEFFVHILIHFWILDNDFLPLPMKVCKSFGVVLPLRSVLAELFPTPGLVEVVNVLVKYLNSSLVSKAVDLVEVTVLRGQLLLQIWDSDSLMEEIDLFCTPDYPMPPSIVDEDYDSERDILIPKNLPSNNSLSFAEKSHSIFIFLRFLVLLQNHQMVIQDS
nr:sphingomyelin phosphodiesterase [Tanacetum cinerariifolium]